MSVEYEIIVNGHVPQKLLHEFAQRPDDFDDDAVEEIWQHLDECEECVEEYEAIREGRTVEARDRNDADESPAPPVASDKVEPDAFDPKDLSTAKIAVEENDDSHINGLVPVGDDPDRNGLPEEYLTEEEPAEVETESESPADAIEIETGPKDDLPESGEDEENAEDSVKVKVEAIEGLITGEVFSMEDAVASIETETAVEAGRRMARETLEAADIEAADENTEPVDEAKDIETLDLSEDAGKLEADEKDMFVDAVMTPEKPSRPSSPGSSTLSPPEEKPKAPTGESQPSQAAKPKAPGGESQSSQAAKPKAPGGESQSPRTARPAQKPTSEPLENLINNMLAFITRPRNAIVFGAAVVAVAAALVVLFSLTETQKSSPVAGWAPLNVIETSVPLQEVLVRRIRRGRIPEAAGTDVTLDFRGIDELVIAVDLDFVDGRASKYEAVVRDPSGAVVFQEEIPQLYLDDGRFFLRLIPKQFETEQLYELDLVAHHDDGSQLVIAQSAFDVVK